jgi:hypothetical protein
MLSFARPSPSTLAAVLVTALVLPLGSPASAQCFGPDHLDGGPCCSPTLPNLPGFIATTTPGLGICWSACSVSSTHDLQVVWTTPVQGFCGEYTSLLSVADAGTGATLLTGTLVLDYTRTWDELDPAGAPMQVWRFAAKADLRSLVTGTAAPPCPVPSCLPPLGPNTTAFYYGYLDYASCPTAGTGWQTALVLFHNCDRFIHQPGLSDKPGVFHPGASYAVVAPHNAAQPFAPANQIASGGPLVAEATRTVDTLGPPPFICRIEDRVASGSITPLGAGCVCTMMTNPKQQTLREFKGTTGCANPLGQPGTWFSVNANFPVFPWYHMVTTSIGTWTSPLAYPGQESAWVDEGIFVHRDACTGDWVEMKYGGTTRDGWTALLPIPVPTRNFTDLADNWTAKLTGPYPTPILGSIRQTDRLIYVNEP